MNIVIAAPVQSRRHTAQRGSASYETIALCAVDPQMRPRIAAAISVEGDVGMSLNQGALFQADQIQWQCCAEPGWGEAWEYAVNSGNPSPGADPAVISDGMILTAVQKHLAILNPPPVAPEEGG